MRSRTQAAATPKVIIPLISSDTRRTLRGLVKVLHGCGMFQDTFMAVKDCSGFPLEMFTGFKSFVRGRS